MFLNITFVFIYCKAGKGKMKAKLHRGKGERKKIKNERKKDVICAFFTVKESCYFEGTREREREREREGERAWLSARKRGE
jgi:hypothetical protein